MTTDTLPLIVIRAQKVAALLALAHHGGIPIPAGIDIATHPILEDLRLGCTAEEFAAWVEWLGATPCRDFPGSLYRAAECVAHLADLGPVTVRLSTRRVQ